MIRISRRGVAILSCGLGLLATVPAPAADILNATLFNATTNSGGDEAAGLGTGFSVSSAVGGVDDPEGAFGNNDGPVEPSSFLFGDGGTVDNGNGILGDGGETVDSLSWSTTSPVLVTGYRADISGDGGGTNRGTELFAMNLAGEGDDLWDANFGSGAFDRTFAVPQIASSFLVRTTRSSTSGPRINEIDARVPSPMPGTLRVAPIHFNATTNVVGEGDQAPGLASGFGSSALLGGETIQDAFGNNNGGIEPDTVLFSDSGAVADNLNNTFDVGVETIDFISWSTSTPLTVHGYQIGIGADSAAGYRGTEMLRFYVDGVVRDTIDANHVTTYNAQRLFDGGAVTGSSFRLEVTRFAAGGGPRIFEIDPILAQNVAPTAEANGAYGFSAGTTSLNLSSTGSVDPELIPLTAFSWQVSGGPTLSGASPALTLLQSGLTSTTATNTVSLTVTDFEGATGSDSATLQYTNAAPTGASAGPALSFSAGTTTVTSNASANDADLSINSQIANFENETFAWRVGATPIGNTPTQTVAPTATTATASNAITLAQAVAQGLTSTTATLNVALSVQDNAGASSSSSVTLSYTNAAPSPSASAVGNPDYSITFNGTFNDADLVHNSLASFFEKLTYEFDLAPAVNPADVGSGAGMFATGMTTGSQTTPGLLNLTLNYNQLIALFGGRGTFNVYANVVDQAGSVQAFQFQARVVPEPATWLTWSLLAAGGLAAARYRRRRVAG